MLENRYNPFDILDERLSKIERSFEVIASYISGLGEKAPDPESPDQEDIKFNIDELAEYLKCSKVTIHNYKRNGALPFYQVGRTVLFKKSAVDEAMSSMKPLRRNKKGESRP